MAGATQRCRLAASIRFIERTPNAIDNIIELKKSSIVRFMIKIDHRIKLNWSPAGCTQ